MSTTRSPWQRTHTCGDLNATHEGREVVLNGWIENHRHHGQLIFLDLRDRYGVTQLVVDQETKGADAQTFETVKRLGAEDVLYHAFTYLRHIVGTPLRPSNAIIVSPERTVSSTGNGFGGSAGRSAFTKRSATIGMLAKQTKLNQLQIIPIPAKSKYMLEQWAAFSLRYCTAWSNWELAYGTLRLLLTKKDLPRPQVFAWGGGVSLGTLVLAKHYDCDVTQMASTDEHLETIRHQGVRAVDRRTFRDLNYDKKKFKADEEYTKKYLASEDKFLSVVGEITGGKGVNIFVDYVGAPVLRATLKALAREGVITTAGWKEGMMIELVRATECIARHQHINTHYARYDQGVAAVKFGEEKGWMPPVDPKVYGYDEVPQMFEDYHHNKLGWFPVYRVNG